MFFMGQKKTRGSYLMPPRDNFQASGICKYHFGYWPLKEWPPAGSQL